MKITYKLLGNCLIEGTPLDSIMKIVDDGEKTKKYVVPCDPANTENIIFLVSWDSEHTGNLLE